MEKTDKAANCVQRNGVKGEKNRGKEERERELKRGNVRGREGEEPREGTSE